MDKTLNYTYKGVTYKVEITYKKNKYITYRFRNGVIVVYSPKRVKDDEIIKGIDKFAHKIIKDYMRNEGNDGDGMYLLGVYCKFNLEKRIYFTDGSYIEYKDMDDLTKKLKKFFLKVLIPRVAYYSSMMNIKKPYNVKVKNMSSRYGSNSLKTRTLNFSLVLCHYSLDIIDAVIVHELAHEFQRNHSSKFYDIVLKYYPNYYNEHKKLKRGIFKWLRQLHQK